MVSGRSETARLPADAWRDAPMRRAWRTRDFRAVFHLACRLGLTPETIASNTGLPLDLVLNVMNGSTVLGGNPGLIVQVAAGFGMPDDFRLFVGLAPPAANADSVLREVKVKDGIKQRTHVGLRIGSLRRERGLTQEALAERAGISTVTVAKIERQDRSPSLSMLEKLSDALGVPAGEILDSPTPRPRETEESDGVAELEKAESPEASFGAELTRFMAERAVGVHELARRTDYSPGYISNLRTGTKAPSPMVARKVDSALDAEGQLIEAERRVTREQNPQFRCKRQTSRIQSESGKDVRARFDLILSTPMEDGPRTIPAERDDSRNPPPPHLADITGVELTEFGINPDEEERIILAARRPSRIDSKVTVPLKKILAAQRETEDVVGSAPLIEPVMGQLAMLENIVKEARGPARAEITDIAAQWAEYAGWLHTSTRRWQEAHGWFDRTSEWAVESGNTTLAATALSFKGHVAFLLGRIGSMVGLTQAAQRDQSVWVGQRAYDAHQEARGSALLGDPETAVRKVDEGTALALIAHEQSDRKPPWIYYYTLPFYALERGMVYRFLGRDNPAHNDEAIASLTSALADAGEARSSEWAAEYICHLAISYIQAGSPDKACEAAFEVVRIARTTESVSLKERLWGIYARLVKRWPNDPCVTELGEALRLEQWQAQ